MTLLLYGFASNSIISRKTITLAIEMRSPPHATHHFIEFLVVDNMLAYNGVLGRPTLKEIWGQFYTLPTQEVPYRTWHYKY